MKLKILMVPMMVILSLIIIIGFIKPDYDSLTQKKAALVQKKADFDRLETLRSNIASLTTSLDQNKELETFVMRFYPLALDQERAIDAFNFLAAQSGLTIVEMDIKEVIVDQKEGDVVPGESPDILAVATAADSTEAPTEGEVQAIIYKQPTPGSYTARVKVKGNYDNIKTFFAKVYRLDRMHEVKNMTIGIDTKAQEKVEGEEQTPPPSDLLIGSFEARFDYVANKDNKSALGAAIFGKNAFDIAQAEKLKTWAETKVADLVPEQQGRANPFQ